MPPSLSFLPGFRVQMLGLDILHIMHLGVGRDMVASVIRVLTRLRFWRGNNLDTQLASASVSLRNFAASQKLNLRLRKLSKQNLNWKANEYPEAHCKGYDTYILLKWLQFSLDQGGRADVPNMIQTLVWSANNVFGLMANAEMFLTPAQQDQVQTIGNLFVHTYVHLASAAVDRGELLWKVRPKLHMLQHVFLESGRASGLNFHFISTWMDEDSIKRYMQVKKKFTALQPLKTV